jgi:opacity protein-like surface antigen
MKKVLLLLTAASTMIFAGGDIAPVEPIVATPAPVVEAPSPIKFYVGGGYSRINADGSGGNPLIYQDTFNALAVEALGSHSWDINANNYLLLAGVKVNEYFAIEGRYSNSFEDFDYKFTSEQQYAGTLNGGEIESYGIYAKPMYPVTEQIDVYGLLGYGNTKITGNGGKIMDSGDFSWGAGASYEITNNISAFADYVRLYDDTVNDVGSIINGDKVKVDSVNVGLIYTF